MTGAGMASIRSRSLGQNAIATSARPKAAPTGRAATPVNAISGTVSARTLFGTVPATPDTKLLSASATTVPCTGRKSTARAAAARTPLVWRPHC